jgi:DNA-binding transcriptional LysR family regulator
MELRQLRYFVAVAEEQSVRRAAARLHVAPPSISVQIHQLEAEMSVNLFSRERRRIKLTEAGHVFLHQARTVLRQLKRGVNLAQQADNGEIGHLSIGYVAGALFLVLPKIVPLFKKTWPNVHLTFQSMTGAQQCAALLAEEIDLGFATPPIPEDQFDLHELVKEPFAIAVPAGHRLARKRTVSIMDLSGEPLVQASRAQNPDLHAEIAALFQRAGAVMNVAVELEDSLSMTGFVAMGLGCSFVPDYARWFNRNDIMYKPLKAPRLVKAMAIVKKRGKSGLSEQFFRFATKLF